MKEPHNGVAAPRSRRAAASRVQKNTGACFFDPKSSQQIGQARQTFQQAMEARNQQARTSTLIKAATCRSYLYE